MTIANLNKARTIKRLAMIGHDTNQSVAISVLIPAHNEEVDIARCVDSVFANDYAHKQVVVVDDGSNDQTPDILDSLALKYPDLIVVHQENAGKATALNNGLKSYTTHDIVMVLDGDSTLAPDALRRMVAHFINDERLVAVAANVNINKATNLIEHTQKLEYLIGYKYKESEPVLNLEYIIGGIGSTFRRSALLQVGGYDTDSITEDIALSLKLIHAFGNKQAHFDYAPDVICYTPPARNFNDLRKQRLRWKYGRFKALVKYRELFFSRDLDKYSLTLTWWKLPKIILFEEIMMLLEPLMLLAIGYFIAQYADISIITGCITTYLLVSIVATLSDTNSSFRNKIKLLLTSPFTIALLYIINVVDFLALITCIHKRQEILFNTSQVSKWDHISR